MAPTQGWLTFAGGAVPKLFHITHDVRALTGAYTAVHYAELLHEHMTPLFPRLTRIAPKIL